MVKATKPTAKKYTINELKHLQSIYGMPINLILKMIARWNHPKKPSRQNKGKSLFEKTTKQPSNATSSQSVWDQGIGKRAQQAELSNNLILHKLKTIEDVKSQMTAGSSDPIFDASTKAILNQIGTAVKNDMYESHMTKGGKMVSGPKKAAKPKSVRGRVVTELSPPSNLKRNISSDLQSSLTNKAMMTTVESDSDDDIQFL